MAFFKPKKIKSIMSKSVQCKFTCESVTNYNGSKTAKLRAVSGKEGDNSDFTKFTPNGEISVNITNDAPADGVFVPGENYYVTFDKEVKQE